MFKPLLLATAAILMAAAAPVLAQSTSMTPEDQVKAMGPGINVAAGWDPYWDGNPSPFKIGYIKSIKDAGFKTIRIPITTFRHMDKAGQHLDPATFRRLDAIVDAGVKEGLNVIIDEHDYDDCGKDANACGALLPNVWYELSEHYKNAPPSVMFELLNEPHEQIDDKLWNAWIPDLVAIVRETNPTRNIIIGATHWNSKNDLPLLKLPEADRHIIVTFHYYDPFHFTHQGASWAGAEVAALKGVEWKGTKEELAQLDADFDQVAAWGKANNRPIFLGEYGTYGKNNPRMDERAAWTRAVSKAADARGFARAFWYFSEGPVGFTAYNTDKDQWVAPIKDALVGQ